MNADLFRYCLRWCRQRRQATAKNSSQASDQRIFDTVNTLDLMRTSTEFASEISAPRISTSFEIHLDFLVNLGEVGVYHVCMCFIVSIPYLVTPRHRFVMMHYADKKEQFLSYTPQFDTTLRTKGYNVKTWNVQIDCQ